METLCYTSTSSQRLLRWARAGWAGCRCPGPSLPPPGGLGARAQRPTLKQLEDFAKATHTAVGYLFLPTPPIERVPIPDYRTVGNVHIGRPSPDLLDTIYLCQQRQEWYHDYARSMGEKPLAFVGAASIRDDVSATAANIRGRWGSTWKRGVKWELGKKPCAASSSRPMNWACWSW